MQDCILEEHKVHLVVRANIILFKIVVERFYKFVDVLNFFIKLSRCIKLKEISKLHFVGIEDLFSLKRILEVLAQHIHGLIDEPFSIFIVDETIHEDTRRLIDPESSKDVILVN